jgi:hypothetical protein
MSGYSPEAIPPDLAAAVPAPPPDPPPVCHVVALALKPLDAVRPGLQWHFHIGSALGSARPPVSVEALGRVLAGEAGMPAGGWQLNHGGRVELRRMGGEDCL